MVDGGALLTYHSFLMSRFFHGGRPRLLGSIVPSLPLFVMLAVASAFCGTAGCASGDDVTKPITYSLTAKQNYEKGLAQLKDENYPDAARYFSFVKQKFPFSKYAVLAHLHKLSDSGSNDQLG